ncbi:MAG: hypothetical protein Kow0027_01580 [Saprospiraceae bacterium]
MSITNIIRVMKVMDHTAGMLATPAMQRMVETRLMDTWDMTTTG